MRSLGPLLVFCLLAAGSGNFASAQRSLPVPVHPDTLPTLTQHWSLPASLAPHVTNAYAPRLTLSGSSLFVFDHHGRRLAAVEAQTGKVLWHAPVPSASDQAFAFTPLVAGDRVFVANHGYLYAFDANSGKLRWELGTKGVAVNGLARSKHRIFLPWIRTEGRRAMAGVHVWAVDSRLGRVEWSKRLPGLMAFLAADADGVYFVGSEGAVLGLTPDRGEPRWQLRVAGDVRRPPVLRGGRLYVSAERRKAGWAGTVLQVIDVKSGKALWSSKLPSTRVSLFLENESLIAVESSGKLTRFDSAGKKTLELDLELIEEPASLQATSAGDRAYVFSSHADGRGYIRLVDLEKQKLLAVANAVNSPARALVPADKLLFLDGDDGTVHALRMDRSQPPRRQSVPPDEFAREMIEHVAAGRVPARGMAARLAGLGNRAVAAVEPALQSADPRVVAIAAEALGLMSSRRSVPSLLQAVSRLEASPAPAEHRADPLLAVLDALAELEDGRAVPALQKVMRDETQSHHRRRAVYVALGAIGSPVSLAPIWAFRALFESTSAAWEPQAFTPSGVYRVEDDVTAGAEDWPEELRRVTSLTVQTKDGRVFTAALSPYLGGYNDIWVGPSDLAGQMSEAYFTGLTKPEVVPGRRLRLSGLKVTDKGQIEISIKYQRGGKGKWVAARPVKLSLADLAADRDGDKLPDLVEKRLRTCVKNADCDGDGISDGEDLNPLAAAGKLTADQVLFREAFFTFYAFLKRRGIVVVDPGEGPSFELYGRRDPVISLRRPSIEKLRKESGLHAIDYVSFGGPYPEGGGSGDALPGVVWNEKKTEATIGMDIFRSGENAVAFNVTLRKQGKHWVVARFYRVWTTNH